MSANGLCECGCNQRTTISDRTDAVRGWIKGQPKRFINNHRNRLYNSGQRWGRLVMLRRDGNDIECDCDCGRRTTVALSNLVSGRTASCGCLRHESRIKHGHAKNNGNDSFEYKSFKAMLARCFNPKHKAYSRYGGAGVTVADAWNPAKSSCSESFLRFLSDLGPCPKTRDNNGRRIYTLSRFSDTGNYEAGNVAWHTWHQHKQQANNRRTNICKRAA